MVRRAWLAISVLVAAGGAVLIIVLAMRQQAGVAEGPTPVKPAEEKSQKPAVRVRGAQIEQRDASGALQWRVMAAGEIEYDDEHGLARGQDTRFEMIREGKTPLVLKAPKFEANYKSGRLTFSKGVTGSMTDGSARFSVNNLQYQFDTGKLVGSGGARYVHGSYQATADTIVIDVRAKKARLRGGVCFSKIG